MLEYPTVTGQTMFLAFFVLMNVIAYIAKIPRWVGLYVVIFLVFMTTAGALHQSEPVKQARMERQIASFEIREVEVTITPIPNEFASSLNSMPEDEQSTSSSELISVENIKDIVQEPTATPTPEFRELLLEEAASTVSAKSASGSASETN